MVNVKIQYTVELDDLPKEIGKILIDCYKKMDEACEAISSAGNACSFQPPYELKQHIESLKKTIESQSKNLNRLDEMVHILESYQKIKNLTPEEMAKLREQTTLQQPIEKQEFTDS